MIATVPTSIPGCLRLSLPAFRDDRGVFVKTFRREWFGDLGLAADIAEEFHTISGPRVLRGLHFQLPPHEHVKVVCCVHGRILDALLDLRRGSPTFGRHELFELSGAVPELLYVAPGVAHGFYALEAPSVVTYRTSTGHSPAHDAGVHWASAGIAWPDDAPVVSTRDRRLPPLAEFDTPFAFRARG